MSHTYSSVRVHVIFSAKERKDCIAEEIRPKLWPTWRASHAIMDSKQSKSAARGILRMHSCYCQPR